MSQHACWEWNPETQDATAQIFEGSLIWKMLASLPPPHPSEFHWHSASSLWSTGFLPFCHSQPTAEHRKPPSPEANDYCSLLGFRTRPQIHPYSKPPPPNIQSWRKIQSFLLERLMNILAESYPVHGGNPAKRWNGLCNILAESVRKWNALPPAFGMRSIKKQNDLENIFQVQWV